MNDFSAVLAAEGLPALAEDQEYEETWQTNEE